MTDRPREAVADACRAINSFLSGRAPPPPGPEQPYVPRQTTPPPPLLEPDILRKFAAALRLLASLPRAARHPQGDDPRAIGDAILARRRAVDEFNERIASAEGCATVTAPPTTFTELAFAAWCHAVLKRGLVDADALLLAVLVWLTVGRATGRDTSVAVSDFLLELARADDSPDSAAGAVTLMTDAPQTPPLRRRPKGPSEKTRAYVARRREAVRARTIDCEPWTLLDGLTAEIEKQIAIDDGTRSDVSKSRSGAGLHWYGNHTRGLPSLRRACIVEAIADHCAAWWVAAFRAETTAPG